MEGSERVHKDRKLNLPSSPLPPHDCHSAYKKIFAMLSSSSSPIRTLPSLPTELKKEIPRLCDCSTLARTSRVSLAFLQLSAPLLYSHVDLQGAEQFQRMLVERVRDIFAPYISSEPRERQLMRFDFLSSRTQPPNLISPPSSPSTR